MSLLKYTSISIFFMFLTLLPGSLKAKPLLVDGESEVLLFSSFECPACYQTSLYLNAWSGINKEVPVKIIPVFDGSQWRASARLYFLVELSKEAHNLNSQQRLSTVFSISKMHDLVDEKVYMINLLKSYGMQVTAYDFNIWWNASTVMLDSSSEILGDVDIESAEVPFVRISSKKNKDSYFVTASNIDLVIKQLNLDFSTND